ncbi:unnamed protein product [Rotaria socialis]|uniref:Uncharacterized protein n=1 Tax=Rotaria socialis TaxID=392032 RepID=A0A817V2L0_9BILA|nr:unnamed protein product [Rotaria socialis]
MNEEALSSSNSTSISSDSPSLSSASSSFSTSTSKPIDSSTIQSSSPSDTLHSSYRTTSQPTPHYSKSTGFITSRDSYNSSYNFSRNCYLTAEAKNVASLISRTISISSDLTHAGRIDAPVISTEKHTIAPYHIAYIQVKVPSSVASHTWDASITGHRSHIATANSLIRFTDRKSVAQTANCSSRQQLVYRGQHIALGDLYLDDLISNIAIHSLVSSLPILSSSTTWESPILLSTIRIFHQFIIYE